MLLSVARFEFRYQLRSSVFWAAAAMFFLFPFATVASEGIGIGSGGNVHVNSPRAIIVTHLLLAILFMFALAAMVANGVVRDDETRFGPLIRTTRLSKTSYLLGRFLGGWAASAVCFATVPVAMWIGSLMPWLDPDTLGTNKASTFAFAYAVMGLPVLLITGAVLFSFATAFRSMMAAYLAIVVLLAVYAAMNVLIGSSPTLRPYAPYLEPFGIAAFSIETRYWTAFESNTLLPPLFGTIGRSRLIWVVVAFATLAFAHQRYNHSELGISRTADRRRLPSKSEPETTLRDQPRLEALPSSSWPEAWKFQLIARTAMEFRLVVRSPAFIVLLGLAFVIALPQMWFGGEQYGTLALPLTRRMIEGLRRGFAIVPVIVAIYYSGDVVWREREIGLAEIVDAYPLPGWAFQVPKMLGVTLALIAILIAGALGAVALQLLRGAPAIEPEHYLFWYLLPQAVDLSLLAVLAVVVQSVSPSKHIGWAIMVLYVASSMFVGDLGLEDGLYNYGSTPPEPLSDMNSAGGLSNGAWWFRAYRASFACILIGIGHVLWRRGTDARLSLLLRRLPRTLSRRMCAALGVSTVLFATTGAFIWYNIHYLNMFRTDRTEESYSADYERTLLRFENVPQPSIRKVRLRVDLRPKINRIDVHGAYLLRNDTGRPLHAVHVRLQSRDLSLLVLKMANSHLTRDYPRFGYRIYAFDSPMMPGEARELQFVTRRWRRGFANGGGDTRLVANGTFLNNIEISPRIGMDQSGLLDDRRKRRRQSLVGELRVPKLEDATAQNVNYIGADWTKTDITISTDASQTPIAPGRKVLDRTEHGRRTARFVSDAPMLNFFSVQSAAYAERHVRHHGADLAVYYHPDHPWNVDRMLRAMAKSLDYYQTSFGPYQFDQLRIIEFPNYSQYAQSFANTIPYSENMGFDADLRSESGIDYVTYVTAHEAAHQYWAHQIIGANMQGATVLSETLAQYSALMVMRKMYGRDHMRRFLSYELDQYLTGRRHERNAELPLGRVEDQQYIHYSKGSLAMYLLQDRMGEAPVNRALSAILKRYRFQGRPYPRSTDLEDALLKEASSPEQRNLIADLFERISLYEVKAISPTSRQSADGSWLTDFTASAIKVDVDGRGRERPTPLSEQISVGAFRADPGDRQFTSRDILSLRQLSLRSGEQRITIRTQYRPSFVGVDPYNMLIDRHPKDNVAPVPK